MKRAIFALVALVGAVVWIAAAPQAAQKPAFETPEKAAQALIDAAAGNDAGAMLNLFGPAGKQIVESGDAAEDQHMRERFAARAKTQMRIEIEPAILTGRRWLWARTTGPFPFPW